MRLDASSEPLLGLLRNSKSSSSLSRFDLLPFELVDVELEAADGGVGRLICERYAELGRFTGACWGVGWGNSFEVEGTPSSTAPASRNAEPAAWST